MSDHPQARDSFLPRALNRLATLRYGVLLFLAVYGLIWTVIPFLSNAGMPVDVVEELAWAREWPLGVYRHPPMMVWLLEIAWQATGQWIGSIYLLSAVAFGAGAWFLYRLLLTQRPRSQAVAGTLLIAVVYFFGPQLPQWNANIAQLPFVGLFLFAVWTALKHDSWPMWVLSALSAVCGFLAKYSFALMVISTVVVVVASPDLRRRINPKFLALAIVVFAVALSPHLWWYLGARDDINAYMEMSLGRDTGSWIRHVYNPPLVAVTVAGILLPAFLFLRFGFARTQAEELRAPADDRALTQILLAATFGPMLISAVIGAVTGGLIKDQWLISYFFSAPAALVMLLVPARVELRWNRGGARLFTVALAVLMIAYPFERLRRYIAPGPNGPIAWSPLMPPQPLADAAYGVWRDARQQAGLPDAVPAIVAGGIPAATAVNLMTGRPAWLEHFDPALSPWVTAAMISGQGVLGIGEVPAGFTERYGLCRAAVTDYDWQNGWGEVASRVTITALLPQGQCRN